MKSSLARIISTAIACVALAGVGYWLLGNPHTDRTLLEHAARNELYVMYRDRIAGIDPIQITGHGSAKFTIAVDIYEPLYQYHYLKRPYELIPCLAADMPKVSDDGLTYTITLRDDVRFEDNACFADGKDRSVTAEDWIYSWKRLADPRNASPAWSLLVNRIAGLDDFRQAIKDNPTNPDLFDAPIEGLVAVSPRVLEIRLTKPWPQLPMILALPCMSVVSHQAVDYYGEDFIRHPVGTGPYRVKQWRPDEEILLEKSPSYRGEKYPSKGEPGDREAGLLADAGKTMPFIDRVSIRFVGAGEPTWLMLMQGQLDMHGVPGGKQFDSIVGPGRVLRPHLVEHGLILGRYPSVFVRWVGFNMNDPVIGSSRKLREAISLAFNRQEFNEIFLGGRNDLPIGLIPPVLAEHDPDHHDPFTRYDPDEARRLIAEVVAERGGKPIPPISMVLGGNGAAIRQVGELIMRWMNDVGLEFDPIYASEKQVNATMRDRSIGMFFGAGYGVRYPDPCDLFFHFYYAPDENITNAYHYNNPRFNELYRQASMMPNGPQRTKVINEMEQVVMHDRPCILFLNYNWMFVHYDWLKNFKPHAFHGNNGMAKYLRIDTALRVRRLTTKE